MDIATRNRRNRWRSYNYERRVAKLIGGVVVGRSKAIKTKHGWIEIGHQHPPDVVSDTFSVECKYHKELPKGITQPLVQAIRDAPTGLMPVVFMGSREGSRVVILSEKDFLMLVDVNYLARGE
jgi:hypothetical protein